MPTVTLTMNACIDTAAAVERVMPDHKLRCSDPSHDPGGGGINVARVLTRLGAPVTAVYPAGGPSGTLLNELMQAEGVAYAAVPIREWTRENLIIGETSTGEEFRFIMPGPTLSEAEQRECLEAVAACTPDLVVISGSLPPGVPPSFPADVIRAGREHGYRVVLDASGEPLRRAARAGPFLLKPNLPELESLAGRELTDEADQEAAARSLVEQGFAEIVVVSLGAGGALLATPEGITRYRAPAVRVRSRVGAGDSMVAGLVFGLTRHHSLHEAMRWGIAAGTAAVMSPGTQLCSREDAEHLLPKIVPVG